MNICRRILSLLMVAAASISCVPLASASTLDRFYRMGDDPGEPTTNGGPVADGTAVNFTRDSQGVPGASQLIHLSAVNTPTYRTIAGRPDGGGGLGIEFNAGSMEYLRGPNLGDPSQSVSTQAANSTLNYTNIFDRGLQFWVRPTSTAVQSLVMDTNQHGARINSNGKFSMRYANVDYESTVTVAPNTWYHVEVVRPATFANGSRMYVNGIAVAAAPGGYDDDASELVVGSNTGGDGMVFTGGTSEFFSGVIDDLKMFVIGQAPARTTPTALPAANWGSFNFATDNDFADFTLTGVVGDLNHSGTVTQADKDAFIAGWMDKKLVNGLQIGDLETYGDGDVNFDGITNIFDLAVFQGALAGAGMGGITSDELLGIPEPGTVALLLTATFATAAWRRPRLKIRR